MGAPRLPHAPFSTCRHPLRCAAPAPAEVLGVAQESFATPDMLGDTYPPAVFIDMQLDTSEGSVSQVPFRQTLIPNKQATLRLRLLPTLHVAPRALWCCSELISGGQALLAAWHLRIARSAQIVGLCRHGVVSRAATCRPSGTLASFLCSVVLTCHAHHVRCALPWPRRRHDAAHLAER